LQIRDFRKLGYLFLSNERTKDWYKVMQKLAFEFEKNTPKIVFVTQSKLLVVLSPFYKTGEIRNKK
jgi:hypothetical protein